jgi:hypothetical protein
MRDRGVEYMRVPVPISATGPVGLIHPPPHLCLELRGLRENTVGTYRRLSWILNAAERLQPSRHDTGSIWKPSFPRRNVPVSASSVQAGGSAPAAAKREKDAVALVQE